MIHKERIGVDRPGECAHGSYVLYWMHASQRCEGNHALEYAIRQANERGLPVLAGVGLGDCLPGSTLRHCQFALEGLREVEAQLRERKIRLVVLEQGAVDAVVTLSNKAVMVVSDCGYTRQQRQWRKEAGERLACPLISVESNVIFPVATLSDHEEYAARTIRPKIKRHLDYFLQPLTEREAKKSSLGIGIEGLSLDDVEGLIGEAKVNRQVGPSLHFRGGSRAAKERLSAFLSERLTRYEKDRNNPTRQGCSGLSPYLHYGQISPLNIALESIQTGDGGANVFLEELVVRRELSVNYVYYNENYDRYDGLPEWSRRTLEEHQGDRREYVYEQEDLEEARTHDPYWNAAQEEMRITGKMHGYMRMYWGKKLLEWSATPQEAFRRTLYLNDKYSLDGSDPNGYAGIAWCYGKHDRPWVSRPITGSLRYMNVNGLKRKFDADRYVEQINRLKEEYTW